MIRFIAAAAMALACVTGSAEARQRHPQTACSDVFSIFHPECQPAPQRTRVVGYSELATHPTGCPRIAFCGCGAAVRVFGRSIRSLWLAANWFRFPRSQPAPGMVAVRRHHVFVLEADLGGGIWRVYDANSGGHLTRIHPRSLSGYTIVNPHGA